jgi:hypothetical protein
MFPHEIIRYKMYFEPNIWGKFIVIYFERLHITSTSILIVIYTHYKKMRFYSTGVIHRYRVQFPNCSTNPHQNEMT